MRHLAAQYRLFSIGFVALAFVLGAGLSWWFV